MNIYLVQTEKFGYLVGAQDTQTASSAVKDALVYQLRDATKISTHVINTHATAMSIGVVAIGSQDMYNKFLAIPFQWED